MTGTASNYWSPVKYQLRANMNDVSDRSKKESSGSWSCPQ